MTSFTLGQKIHLPESKSHGCPIWKSTQLKKARELGQKFLYVTEINDQYIVLSAWQHWIENGDYFLKDELIPYTLPPPKAKFNITERSRYLQSQFQKLKYEKREAHV